MTTNKGVPERRTPKLCIHCVKTLHNFHGPFARCEGGKTQYEASPSTTPDFSYMQGSDGFVSIMPNTPAAEDTYNRMYADGVYRLMPHEFAAFKSQAKRAGYTVRKAQPVSIDSLDLSLLNA